MDRFLKSPLEVTQMIRDYYQKEGNSTGGNLHVVLDDDNIEGRNVLWAWNEARIDEDEDGMEIAAALLDFDYTERMDVVAGKWSGYLEHEDGT